MYIYPLSSIKFASYILWFCCLTHMHLGVDIFSWWIDLSIFIRSLIVFFVIFFALKSIYVLTVPAFSWLMLAQYIFFHHFTFNLPISLNLKWASCTQHTDDTYFKIQFVNLCLLIGGFRSFKMNTVIDRWRFKSSTCFLVYCLFISVLHSLSFF